MIEGLQIINENNREDLDEPIVVFEVNPSTSRRMGLLPLKAKATSTSLLVKQWKHKIKK